MSTRALLNLRQSWSLPSRPRPIVIVGAGGIVRNAHLPAYQKAGSPVHGIFDLDRAKAQSLANAYGIKHVYGSPVIRTIAITGIDFGSTNGVGLMDGFTTQIFSCGRLTLVSTNDSLCLACGSSPTDASKVLYVTFLDLTSLTNQASVSWLVTTLLHVPIHINIYYFAGDSRNSCLNDLSYQLTDCNGELGGFLMPAVPEPSLAGLVLAAGAILIGQRRHLR